MYQAGGWTFRSLDELMVRWQRCERLTIYPITDVRGRRGVAILETIKDHAQLLGYHTMVWIEDCGVAASAYVGKELCTNPKLMVDKARLKAASIEVVTDPVELDAKFERFQRSCDGRKRQTGVLRGVERGGLRKRNPGDGQPAGGPGLSPSAAGRPDEPGVG